MATRAAGYAKSIRPSSAAVASSRIEPLPCRSRQSCDLANELRSNSDSSTLSGIGWSRRRPTTARRTRPIPRRRGRPQRSSLVLAAAPDRRQPADVTASSSATSMRPARLGRLARSMQSFGLGALPGRPSITACRRDRRDAHVSCQTTSRCSCVADVGAPRPRRVPSGEVGEAPERSAARCDAIGRPRQTCGRRAADAMTSAWRAER